MMRLTHAQLVDVFNDANAGKGKSDDVELSKMQFGIALKDPRLEPLLLAAKLTADVIIDANLTAVAGTDVDLPIQLCSQMWVLGNVAMLLSCLLDVLATVLACSMFRAVRSVGGGGSEILMQGVPGRISSICEAGLTPGVGWG